MNPIAKFLFVSLICLPVPLMAEQAGLPSGSQGQVTLDWQKFHELWMKMQQMEKKIEDLQKPENLPPVPYTITKAAYKGFVGEKKTEISAIFEIDVYNPKDWVKIPFLPESVAITEAELNGRPVGVVQEEGFHHVLLKKPGRYVLRTRFTLRSPKPEEAPQLTFNIQSTPITLLALEFTRPHLDVQVEPSQGVDVQSVGEKHTLVTAALSPTSSINVRWQKALPEEIAGPAKIYLDSQNLITVAEGTLKARWDLNYSILRHGIRELDVRVPEAWNILSVTGDGLQEWKTIDTTKGPLLHIQLSYARKGNLAIAVQMERALNGRDEVVDIPRLVPVGIEREQGTVGIEAKGAIELFVQNAEALQAIDPRELPGGIWQSATQPILFAFRYTKPYALALSIKRHPETPVLTTTVDDANALTVLTARGQLINRIRYTVRNQLKQYLAVKLPPGTELWSAFVAGEPVKPMKAEDGTFRIPLAKSQLGNQGQAGFVVELITYRPVPKFFPIGYRTLTLPMPDAPVSRLFWSVYLPEKYRFLYFGGDVEKGGMAQPWNALQGGAVVDHAALAYSGPAMQSMKKDFRRNLKGLAAGFGGARSSVMEEEGINKQAELAADLFQANSPVPTASGVFPVAFEVPASGQLFHFGQIMVVGQDPELTMVYLHRGFVRALAFLLVVGPGHFLLKKHRNLVTRI